MCISKTATIPLDHARWRHIWQLAWPIMLSNVTIPLVGAVDVAMMGRLDDPVFIGGVGLGMIVFNFIYFRAWLFADGNNRSCRPNVWDWSG
jgi:Na+-driven multidrug efflux pump